MKTANFSKEEKEIHFVQDNRFVYFLGSERTVIDSEWLLIDFENGVVTEYSITMD